MKVLIFIIGLGLSIQGSNAATIEEASRIIQRKFSKAAEKVPLDENHPALRAAALMEDEKNRDTAVKLCHTHHKNLNVVIGWLKHEANPDAIVEAWGNPAHRPIIESGKLWRQEEVSIEDLADYLKPSPEGRQWYGAPLVIGDDYHAVTLHLREDLSNGKVYADFYDAYEPFDKGSFLEMSVLQTLEYKVYPGEKAPQVEWTTHYLKHQKVTAFGECALYAAVYRSLLLKGLKPETFTQDAIQQKVAALKELIHENHPRYVYEYDKVFNFVFESGFAGHLLAEIKKLPDDWGIDPEEAPPASE
jgi:hypothetical protein